MDDSATQKTIRERKKAIKENWGHICARCMKSFPPDKLTMGHLLPESKGGPWEEGNLVPLCNDCNQHDGNRLASYEVYDGMRAEMLGPDAEGKARLSAYSYETGERIRGQVSYINLPTNQRVELTAAIEGVEFRVRTGYIHEADLGADRYWLVMDEPIALENGIAREVEYIVVSRVAFRYLNEVHNPRVPRIIHTVEYLEIPTEKPESDEK